MEKLKKTLLDNPHVLAVVIVIALLIITVLTFRFLVDFNLQKAISQSKQVTTQIATDTGKLTKEVYDLIDKSKKPLIVDIPSPSPTPYNQQVLQVEVLKLKARIADLEKQLLQPNKTPTPSASSTTSPKVQTIYIPMGIGSSTNLMDWTTVATPSLDIDPADYPGYSAMYFIPELAIYQGNGTAYARLTNSTDGVPLYNTQVSTTSYSFTPVTSGAFTLPSGRKTYQVQLKTTTGYAAMLNFVKIKVVF